MTLRKTTAIATAGLFALTGIYAASLQAAPASERRVTEGGFVPEAGKKEKSGGDKSGGGKSGGSRSKDGGKSDGGGKKSGKSAGGKSEGGKSSKAAGKGCGEFKYFSAEKKGCVDARSKKS